MVGIDLGEHEPADRIGHRVILEARKRGAIIRPLGDVIVLMPPLAISKADLARLVEITADSIRAVLGAAEAPPVRAVEAPAVTADPKSRLAPAVFSPLPGSSRP